MLVCVFVLFGYRWCGVLHLCCLVCRSWLLVEVVEWKKALLCNLWLTRTKPFDKFWASPVCKLCQVGKRCAIACVALIVVTLCMRP